MKKEDLIITVSGKCLSGKSRLTFLLKKFLRENGFEVEFDGNIDHPRENEQKYQFKIKVNMKNKTSILVGIRHFFYAILVIVILQSCGDRTPIIDGEKPFVVGTIIKYNDTHSKYIAIDEQSGEWSNNFEGKPMIILPSRMYQIGDTIKCRFNNR